MAVRVKWVKTSGTVSGWSYVEYNQATYTKSDYSTSEFKAELVLYTKDDETILAETTAEAEGLPSYGLGPVGEFSYTQGQEFSYSSAESVYPLYARVNCLRRGEEVFISLPPIPGVDEGFVLKLSARAQSILRGLSVGIESIDWMQNVRPV